MNQASHDRLSPSHARLLRGAGIAVALVAIVLFLLGLAGLTDLPLYIPLLLLGAASGILLGVRSRRG